MVLGNERANDYEVLFPGNYCVSGARRKKFPQGD